MRLLVCVMLGLCFHVGYADQPAMIATMTGPGITLNDEVKVVLPAPSLKKNMDDAARKDVLEALTRGKGWKQFSRNSVNAPITINLKYIKSPSGDRIGHQVHFAFVIHASLETLKDKDLMKSMAADEKEPDDSELYKMDEVTEEDLKALGIDAGENDSYGVVQAPLMNRVILRGTVHTEQTVVGNDVMMAWEMDPRFTGAAKNANTWSSIKRDKLGKKVEGEPQPYRGAGGYMHVSELKELDGACLVESHMVIHEPKGWFSGSNALRSKMPLLIQDSARKFRRKLGKK